jgi:hypothetical protein
MSSEYDISVSRDMVRAGIGPGHPPESLTAFFRGVALACAENNSTRLLLSVKGVAAEWLSAESLYDAVVAMFESRVPAQLRVAIVVGDRKLRQISESVAHAAASHGARHGTQARVFRDDQQALEWLAGGG